MSVVFTVVTVLCLCVADHVRAAEPLMVFCGAAFKKPMEEVAGLYQKKTGTSLNVMYAGTGTLFSQILLSKQGDVFVVPSPDIMERARKKNVIDGSSVKSIAYVVPCINVQVGNPMKIRGLKDLARPGLRVGIANPEIVYIGAIAVEIVDKQLSADEKASFRKNVVTYAEDFNKLATMLVLKQVDAVIGMHFLEGWYPDKVTTVKMNAAEVSRIGSAQAAVISYTSRRADAARFIDFLSSVDVQPVLRKYHYFATPQEAFSWVGAKKPIGGEFSVAGDWVKK
jgi:molybdate transport system substrate-binding protein